MWTGLPFLAMNESLTASIRLLFSLSWLTTNRSEVFVSSCKRVERLLFAWHVGSVSASQAALVRETCLSRPCL